MGESSKGSVDQPLVTVITVCFNAVETIARTVESVLSQSYSHIEYIIVDGLSTDGTLDIVKKYGDRIARVVSERDEGIYFAMNKGLALAKGQLIGILNADDWYEPGAVQLAVGRHLFDPEAVIYGLMAVGASTVIGLDHTMIPHPTVFVPRNLYQQLGVFNTKYQLAADYELFLRMRQGGAHFQFIEARLANYTMGGASHRRIFRMKLEDLNVKKTYKIISWPKYTFKVVVAFLSRSLSLVSEKIRAAKSAIHRK